ncbi:MAG: lipase maturation factor family protein, partial [Halobacteria archaeon]|nr:lipase maturation factor family protein [Halobacteria archaeon]
IVELAVPFLYFAPEPYASIGGLATIGFQGWLMLTGNFSFLNALTIVQAIATFSDGVITAVIPVSSVSSLPFVPTVTPTPVYLLVPAVAVTVLVLALSIYPVRNMLAPSQVMNTSFDPLHIVNTYGAFGSI